MPSNGSYENNMLNEARKMRRAMEDAVKLLLELGQMLKEKWDEDLRERAENAKTPDLDELASNIEKLKKIQQMTEDGKLYVADIDGKMQPHEWMHNLGLHYEFVNPSMHFAMKQVTRDEFWELLDRLSSAGEIRPVAPEPVKDANQLELPNIIDESHNSYAMGPNEFTERYSNKTKENVVPKDFDDNDPMKVPERVVELDPPREGLADEIKAKLAQEQAPKEEN